MKYIVKVADKSYEVDIEDIHARPVIAHVGGETFEINPENGAGPKPATGEVERGKTEYRGSNPIAISKQPGTPELGRNQLTAPLPGTVIEIFVKTGDQIESGQVILIIEAMKMKNSIRSTRAGKIAEVLVSAGQTVAHKQALVRFG